VSLLHDTVELRQFVEEQHALMRQRNLAGLGAEAAAGQGCHAGGMMRGAERPPRGQRAVADFAGDGSDHRDFQQFRWRQWRQDRGQSRCQHRLAGAGRSDHQDMVDNKDNFLYEYGMVSSTPSTRPKAYSYVRMSTDLQLKGDSLRRQLEASRKYAEKHGLDLVLDADLHDIGVSAYSGKNIASGNFGRFLTAVREGMIEKGSYLLVESFDRMSRQEPIVALQPFMDIVNSGLILVTLDDERQFSGKITFEDLIISIAKMSRANEESARKSDRLSKAWENKRNEISSKKLTARCPSWLRLRDDRQQFEIIENHAAIVRRIFEEASSGLGAFSIVRRLNEDRIPSFTGKGGWQTSTVNKILGSKAVIGQFQPSRLINGKRSAEGEPIHGYFPRILDDETFYAAQRGRLERKTAKTEERRGSGGAKGKTFSNLFSKLAICDKCGCSMQFENKGMPPKGQSYLVCSNAIRKHGCPVNTRWRYDQFETMFLSFVERLDLASILSAQQHNQRRNDLARRLDTLVGQEKMIEAELEKTYAILKDGNQTSEFLSKKFAAAEAELLRVRTDASQARAELVAADKTSLDYYANKGELKGLIQRIRSDNDGDIYKLRSRVASRLQSLIKELRLTLPFGEGHPQHFEVSFRDGDSLIVYVDPSNPTQFTQVLRGDGTALESIDEFGNAVTIPMDAPAIGELTGDAEGK